MIEIILDASQLEVFEPCPRKWYYSSQLNLIPLQSRRFFDIGSYYHEVLAYYYTAPLSDRFKATLAFAVQTELLEKFNIKDLDERKFHIKRLCDYLTRYEDEDNAFRAVAVEQGFSYLLYEDNSRRYILEGKIDLVGEGSPYGLFVMDHKTQSRKDDRWEFNHQVCNYLTFTKANYFIYNYIGLQDSLPKDGMRRCIYKPPEGMLEQWKREVTLTFKNMETMILNQKYIPGDIQPNRMQSRPTNLSPGLLESEFPRRRSACDSSKYGLCQYHKLCSIPDDSKFGGAVRTAYKEKEPWKAW